MHLRSQLPTDTDYDWLNDPQMKILGIKFWALGGLNQKSKKTVL